MEFRGSMNLDGKNISYFLVHFLGGKNTEHEIYHFNQLKVYDSGTLSTLSIGQPSPLFQDLFITPDGNPLSIKQSLLPPALFT